MPRLMTIPISKVAGRGDAKDLGMAPRDPRDFPPIIVAPLQGAYELLDGYHRLGAAIAFGAESVKAVVVTSAELDACKEFGDGDLNEDEWIDWIMSIV